MKKAYLFPGQGSQFVGMGKELLELYSGTKDILHTANEILGYDIADIMLHAEENVLQNTSYTQPAVYIHSIIHLLYYTQILTQEERVPTAVAGHSLGEFAAFVAAGVYSFEDGLRLVQIRANAMQKCCEKVKTGLVAITGINEKAIKEHLYHYATNLYIANYNSPSQVVIGGEITVLEKSIAVFQSMGAKLVTPLKVSGAFHTIYMQDAMEELAEAIYLTDFKEPLCPIYQNYTSFAETNTDVLRTNLIQQLVNPVRWYPIIQHMRLDSITEFHEFGPGKVLTNLLKRI